MPKSKPWIVPTWAWIGLASIWLVGVIVVPGRGAPLLITGFAAAVVVAICVRDDELELKTSGEYLAQIDVTGRRSRPSAYHRLPRTPAIWRRTLAQAAVTLLATCVVWLIFYKR